MAPQLASLPSILDPPRFRRVRSRYGEIILVEFLKGIFSRDDTQGHGTLILLAYPLEVCGMVQVRVLLMGRASHVLWGLLREIPKSWGRL